MAIVFAGSSIADFDLGGTYAATSIGVDAQATNFTEGFSLTSSTTIQATATLDLPTALAEFWLSFEHYTAGTLSNWPMIEFYNTAYSTTQPLFTIRWPGTGNIAFHYWNGTAMVASGTFPAAFFEPVTHRYDFHIKMVDVAGIFEVFRDRSISASMTQTDTIQTTATTIDRIRFSCTGTGGGSRTYWHNIFVADEDTRLYEMYSARVTGAGALAQWTGAVADINENGFNDATALSAGANDLSSTFTLETIPNKFANYKVAATFLGGRAQGGTVAPTAFDGVARIGGTVYAQSPLSALPTAFGPFRSRWSVNPATGLPWTVTEIQSTQFGFKSKA